MPSALVDGGSSTTAQLLSHLNLFKVQALKSSCKVPDIDSLTVYRVYHVAIDSSEPHISESAVGDPIRCLLKASSAMGLAPSATQARRL